MHRLIRCLILLLAAGLLLQGCSSVRLGYNNADTLVRWWLDKYVDMSPEQDAFARERLKRFHAWHRKTQLPDYVLLTRQTQKLIESQPTTEEVLTLIEGIMRLGRTMSEQVRPDIADFLLTVSPEQIEHIAERFAEKNVEYAKEVQLSDDASGQRRAVYKIVLERTEYWFGDLSGAQKAALRQLIDVQIVGSQFWYDERLRQQREWLDLMQLVQRDRPPREQIIQQLRDYTVSSETPGDPSRVLLAQTLRRNSAELFVAIHTMTTPEQRSHARHKLADLTKDFAELSREE